VIITCVMTVDGLIEAPVPAPDGWLMVFARFLVEERPRRRGVVLGESDDPRPRRSAIP
jgi:hypothetical protein